MKTNKLIVLAGLATALVLPAVQAQTPRTGNDQQRGQLSESDYKFVVDVARSGQVEVQMGQLASQKGESQAVKDFGQRMVTDHTKANNELKQLISQKGATVPAELSHHEQSSVDRLQNQSGRDFDKVYAKDMAKDHKKDVKEFEKAAKDIKDSDLRAWAQKTLPVLQQHLKMAEQMETSVK
jgi:putative membrane protein